MQNAVANSQDVAWISQVALWVNQAGIINEDVEGCVRGAFSRVSREPFLDQQYRCRYLEDISIPIGNDVFSHRTSLLIRMAALVNLQKRMRILVAGAGDGYLCAALNAAGAQVFGLEAVGALAQNTRRLLDAQGFHGVVIQRGDGNKGWADVGPFDAIFVTYLVSDDLGLPLSQLSINGCLVVPVVSANSARLTVWKRTGDSFKRTVFEEV